jgi:hypothetical protein
MRRRPASEKEALWLIKGDDPRRLGFIFEDHVATVLCSEFPTSDEVVIHVTRSGGPDGGLDIAVQTSVTINLFGTPYVVSDGRRHRIHIDCKYTTAETLNWEKLNASVAKTAGRNVDRFIFVTNARVGARAFHRLRESFAEYNISLTVIERDRLASWLIEHDAPIGNYIPPIRRPRVINVEKSVITLIENDGLRVSIFIRIDNTTSKNQPCRVLFAKSSPWKLDTSNPEHISRKLILGPYESTSLNLAATSDTSLDPRVMQIVVEWDGGYTPVDVVARDVQLHFEPVFQGDKHKQIRDELARIIVGGTDMTCISLVGDAGTGKTRIVNEAIAAAHSNVIRIARIVLQAQMTEITLAQEIARRVAAALVIDTLPAHNLGEVIDWITSTLTYPRKTLLLVIEDLHHGSKELFVDLRRLFDHRARRSSPLILVLTGREDFTFVNQEYYLFLEELRHVRPSNFRLYEVQALDDADAQQLIRRTVEDIPAFALDRIFRLAGSNPFNIVQCIEYLLDEDLAVVLNRDTIGIVDVKGFASRFGLPKAMTALFRRRFDSLLSVENGQQLQDVLHLSSFLGFVAPIRVLAYGGRPALEVAEILRSRRFMHLNEDAMVWVHENLQHFTRELPKTNGEESRIARMILGDPALIQSLERLGQAEVASIAGDHATAVDLYATMLAEIGALTNFSTLDIPTAYFAHVPPAFRSARALSMDSELLTRLLKTGCWIGASRLSIVDCERAAAFSRSVLPQVGLPAERERAVRAWIKQIEAHCQMDSGWTGAARSNLLELECDVQADPLLASDPLLRFDLYNRLQAMYGAYNHYELVEGYGRLAWEAARESGEPALEAKQLLDDALWYQFRDYKRCLRMTRRALAENRRHGTELHTWLSVLSLIVVELPTRWRDKEWLDASIASAQDCLTVSFDGQLWPMLPRAYLTLGVLYLMGSKMSAPMLKLAERCVDLGLDASGKHTIGFTIWQLQCLQAIIVGNLKPGDATAILRRLETAVAMMEREDLLFLGRVDFTCANLLLITNYLRFLARERPADVVQFLRRLKTYDGPLVVNAYDETVILKSLMSGTYAVPFLRRYRRPIAVVLDELTGMAITAAY